MSETCAEIAVNETKHEQKATKQVNKNIANIINRYSTKNSKKKHKTQIIPVIVEVN
jgi:hypothetical protein